MTPSWHIATTEQFDRAFKKLDRATQTRVMSCLEEIENLARPIRANEVKGYPPTM